MAATATGERSADLAWRRGSLRARPGKRRILFGRVYEDSAIEASAFPPGSRVFCIGSAGCTAFALCEARQVVACDINQAQIDYVKHRIGGGAREIGSAERVLGLMRALMPLAGWRRGKIGRFLELDNPDDQLGFWRAELDTWRFRAGLSLLLSPLSLGRMYSSTLLSSLPAHFAQVLRGRLERCFAHHPNRTNPYLRALLSPSSLSESAVPAAASTIDLVVDDAADYLERCAAGSFAGFALSNILDGVREPYRQRLFSAVRRAAAPEASVVLRSFAEPASELSTNQALRDRSLLWGVVDVRSVASL